MKKLGVLTLLMCSAAVQADVKLLVEFDGEKHQIVRVDTYESNLFMQPGITFGSQKIQNKAVVNYQNGDEIISIELEDPRVKRAPMSQDGSGHEEVLLKKGIYTVTLKGDDIDVKTVTMQLPNKKNKTQIEYAVIQ